VIKRQFGLLKVRFRGLQKNTAHLLTLFALSNLWMARKPLMAMSLRLDRWTRTPLPSATAYL